MLAPLPGAVVRRAVMGSPASVVAVTLSAVRCLKACFCSGVAAASRRTYCGVPYCAVSS